MHGVPSLRLPDLLNPEREKLVAPGSGKAELVCEGAKAFAGLLGGTAYSNGAREKARFLVRVA